MSVSEVVECLPPRNQKHICQCERRLRSLPTACRALVEVANLARSQTLKTEACIEELATAVRVAYKVHQFVGGFHADAIALFDKVKGLVQSYVRSRDPTWLRDSSKLTL